MNETNTPTSGGRHVDTLRPLDGATWAHRPYTAHTPGRHAATD